MDIWCLFGYCVLEAEQWLFILFLVGLGVGGFIIGLILGLLAKSGGGRARDREVVREIHYKDK